MSASNILNLPADWYSKVILHLLVKYGKNMYGFFATSSYPSTHIDFLPDYQVL
jgi:hypothetical protein